MLIIKRPFRLLLKISFQTIKIEQLKDIGYLVYIRQSYLQSLLKMRSITFLSYSSNRQTLVSLLLIRLSQSDLRGSFIYSSLSIFIKLLLIYRVGNSSIRSKSAYLVALFLQTVTPLDRRSSLEREVIAISKREFQATPTSSKDS